MTTPAAPLLVLDVPDLGPLRVRVVARDGLVRAGLAARLAASGAAPSVGSDESPADVVVWGDASSPREVVLDDAPDDAPVLALVPDEEAVAAAWAAGARGLLLRDADGEALLAALVAVARGLVVFDPALADAALLRRSVSGQAEVEGLTPREREVLGLIAEGLPNKLVADRLGVSERTAKFHVAQILQKLGAQSRTEAVMRGARLGLVVL